MQVLGEGGALGGPARPGVNFVGKTANLGAAPHDWGFAKKKIPVENSVAPHLLRFFPPFLRPELQGKIKITVPYQTHPG